MYLAPSSMVNDVKLQPEHLKNAKILTSVQTFEVMCTIHPFPLHNNYFNTDKTV